MVVPEVKIEYDRNNIKIVKSAVGTSPKTTGMADHYRCLPLPAVHKSTNDRINRNESIE